MSKSVTVTGSSAYNTVSFTLSSGVDSLTITGSSFNINSLLPTSATVTVGGNFYASQAYCGVGFSKNEMGDYSYGEVFDTSWNQTNPTRSFSLTVRGSGTTSTGSVFNSTNPTEREVTVYYNGGGRRSLYFSGLSGAYTSTVSITSTFTLGQKLVLDAPPTFKVTDSGGTETTQLYFDKAYVYAGLTTASIKVANLSAKYGGTIVSATLTIGDQSVSRSDNGELSILLNAGGTFTPTVAVTDSRGQTTTKTLDSITVNVYTTPTVNFEAQRTLATGVPDDEGTYVVINPKFTFIDAITTNKLQAPTITATDEGGITYTPTVTWYSTRASDGTLSGSVTWNSLSSGDTVYGLLSLQSGFDVLQSYQISVTPIDTEGTGTAKTQMLAPAFFTIDVLAGGHGIAFGTPATDMGFYCNMDAHFVDKTSTMRALFDFIYPVGSYYETSDTLFDPNVTWGGTWSLETEGLVHIGAGSNYRVGDTGGEETHTLTVAEMPNHSHEMNVWPNGKHYYTPSGSTLLYWWSSGYGPAIDQATSAAGGGQAHNNMQPYIVVNRWHRTAQVKTMTFLIGLIVGANIGFFFASLCQASARADRKDNK